MHSTDIYPEWPFAALDHVSKDVSKEVQNALLNLEAYIMAAHSLGGDTNISAACGHSEEVAQLAREAADSVSLQSFRTPRSYFEVRSMHQAAGFLRQDERGNWKCNKAKTLYDRIKCPAGHYKMDLEEYSQACSYANLTCSEGYE
jgi:hypothetical protein